MARGLVMIPGALVIPSIEWVAGRNGCSGPGLARRARPPSGGVRAARSLDHYNRYTLPGDIVW